MKFEINKNSLFAVLLRSPWWVSLIAAAALGLLAAALMPAQYRIAGALSGLPLLVISVVAARRQWRQPSASLTARTMAAVGTMSWPAFAALLEQGFVRDGYAVQPGSGEAFDFRLERRGRTMLVSARRWKAARTGLESLRALQAAREAADAADALFIGLGPLTDNAGPYAARHRIAVWQATELAQALRGLPLTSPAGR